MSKLIRVELKSVFSKFDVKSTLLIFIIFGIALGIINKKLAYSTCDTDLNGQQLLQ